MKLFRTGSLSTVNECQGYFGFLPVKSQILFALLVFLQKFIALENSLCTLFANDARRQLHDIFVQFGVGIKTVCQLRNAIYANFFGGFTGWQIMFDWLLRMHLMLTFCFAYLFAFCLFCVYTTVWIKMYIL